MARREYVDINKTKKIFYIFVFTLSVTILISLIVFGVYSKKLRKRSQENLEKLGVTNSAIVQNNDIELTSFSVDKTVNEAANNKVQGNTVKEKNSNTASSKTVNKNVIDSKIVENQVKNNTTNNVSNNVQNQINEENNDSKEFKFEAPVDGEIIKDYAEDSLLYSNTLEEWTTHPGIDIKAAKTTIVKASERGNVDAIKNDPRYGLTVIIKHENGFKTVYSNLLTSEFVNEGDNVDKGQTIGTIGNTASFEISDDDHLHFEMYKDGKLVNPTIYLK